MENSECQGDVQYDPKQSRSNPHVESHEALGSIDTCKAICESFVLPSFKALHLSLDHVYRVVEHCRAETSKGSRREVNCNFVWDVVLQDILGIFENDEADSLVRRLLENRSDYALVKSANSIF